MIHQIAFHKARAGFPRDAFVLQHEAEHVPALLEGAPSFMDYRRNFPIADGMISLPRAGGQSDPLDIDIITQFSFKDRAAVQAFDHARAQDVTIRQQEGRLFDSARSVRFEAERYPSAEDDLASVPRGGTAPAVKIIGILKRKDGLSPEAFLQAYEEVHVPRALRLIRLNGAPLLAGYIRNYPLPEAQARVTSSLMDTSFDVMTELWFWTHADYDRFIALRSDPDIARELGEGGEQLFDRTVSWLFLVKEHVSAMKA